ncbi:MAG: RHS repeat-associated core domain-containing protein [Candidatus Goldbacteria bacterium]|nr:RHS repeat-associated core domain-containing protein [Candidatus Goldiibacteriota bacterium]
MKQIYINDGEGILGFVRYIYDGSDTFSHHQRLYYLYDSLGSVSAVCGENGLPLQNYTYSPYGSTMNIERDEINGLRFVGRYGGYRDDDSGLTYFWHRWYDASDGRWVSRDPIGIMGGINLFGYVGNQPSFYIDPSGYCPGGEEWQELPIPKDPQNPTKTITTITKKMEVCITKPYPSPTPTPCVLKGGSLLEVTIRCAGRGSYFPLCVIICWWFGGLTNGYFTFLRPTEGMAIQKCNEMGPPCKY